MKPFDLEAALRGAPVKLRNGEKAYIKYVLPARYDSKFPAYGYIETPRNQVVGVSWTLEGKWKTTGAEENQDIVGMWEEPQKMVSINGHEFPQPLREAPAADTECWYVCCVCGVFMANADIWDGTTRNTSCLERGLVHLTHEAAEAHAAALNAVHKELLK